MGKGVIYIKRFLGWVYGFLCVFALFVTPAYADSSISAYYVSLSPPVAYTLGTSTSGTVYALLPSNYQITTSGASFTAQITVGSGQTAPTVDMDINGGEVLMSYLSRSAVSGKDVLTYRYTSSAGQLNETIYRLDIYANGTYAMYDTSFAIATPPPTVAPSGLTSSAVTSSGFTVSWSSLSTASGYNVYLNGSLVGSVTGTSYTFSGLSVGNTYSVQISGTTNGGEGPKSSVLSVSTLGPPATPSGVSVGSITSDGFTVSWFPSVGAQTYNVYVDGTRVSSGFVGTSRSLSGYKSGSSHIVSVSAVNTYGVSPLSSGTSVTLGSIPAPVGLVSSVGDKEVTLTWQPVTGISLYEIYQDGVSYQSVSSGTSFTVSGLTNGTTYQFAVSAVDSSGNSSPLSSPVSARPQPPPVPINGLAFVQYGKGVKIVWGGTMTPFTGTVKDGSGKVISTFTATGDSQIVTGLNPNTVYSVSITDAGVNTLTSNFNSGSGLGIIPPTMPDSSGTFNSMGGLFSKAGTLALYVIGGGLALGSLVIVLVYGWRLLRGWLSRSSSGSTLIIDGEDIAGTDLDGYGWFDDDFKFHVYKEYQHYFD